MQNRDQLLQRSYGTATWFYNGVMEFIQDIIRLNDSQLSMSIIKKTGNRDLDLFFCHTACSAIEQLGKQIERTPQAEQFKETINAACRQVGIDYDRLKERSKAFKQKIESEMQAFLETNRYEIAEAPNAVYAAFLQYSEAVPTMKASCDDLALTIDPEHEILFINNMNYLQLDKNRLEKTPHNEISAAHSTAYRQEWADRHNKTGKSALYDKKQR